MNDIIDDLILKSALLRKVALTKTGDLDIHLRVCGGPDASYGPADVQLLHTLWSVDQLFDVTLAEASDVKEPQYAGKGQ